MNIKSLQKKMKTDQSKIHDEYMDAVKSIAGKCFQSEGLYLHVKSVIENKGNWPPNGMSINVVEISVDTKDVHVYVGNRHAHMLDETFKEITKAEFDKGADKFAKRIKEL
jgi:hypothetical protein